MSETGAHPQPAQCFSQCVVPFACNQIYNSTGEQTRCVRLTRVASTFQGNLQSSGIASGRQAMVVSLALSKLLSYHIEPKQVVTAS